MCVGHEWPRAREFVQQFSQNGPMALPGVEDSHIRESEPSVNPLGGDTWLEMEGKASVCRDAEESEERVPGECDDFVRIEDAFDERALPSVMYTGRVGGIEEHVDVEDLHRRSLRRVVVR